MLDVKQYYGTRFFLFETDINDNKIIKSSVVEPLFVTSDGDKLCIHTIRDMDYSFDYIKNTKKRYIITMASTFLNKSSHIDNIENAQINNTIDSTVYKILADFTYNVNLNRPQYNNVNFKFKLSYIKIPNSNNHMVTIPNFSFNKLYIDNILAPT